MPTSRLLFDEICIEWSATFGGSNMRVYTAMLGFLLAVMDPALAQLAEPAAAHHTQELQATSVAFLFIVAIHHTIA